MTNNNVKDGSDVSTPKKAPGKIWSIADTLGERSDSTKAENEAGSSKKVRSNLRTKLIFGLDTLEFALRCRTHPVPRRIQLLWLNCSE